MDDADRDELRALQRRAYGSASRALSAEEQRRLQDLLARRDRRQTTDMPLAVDTSGAPLAETAPAVSSTPAQEGSNATETTPSVASAPAGHVSAVVARPPAAPRWTVRTKLLLALGALAAVGVGAAIGMGAASLHDPSPANEGSPILPVLPNTTMSAPVDGRDVAMAVLPDAAVRQLDEVLHRTGSASIDPASVRFLGMLEGAPVWGAISLDGFPCWIAPEAGTTACSADGQSVGSMSFVAGGAVLTYVTLDNGELGLRFDVGADADPTDAVEGMRLVIAQRLGVDPAAVVPVLQLGDSRVWSFEDGERRCAVVSTVTMNPALLLAAEPICASGDEELRLISAEAGLVDATGGGTFFAGLDQEGADVWFAWPPGGILTISTRPAQ